MRAIALVSLLLSLGAAAAAADDAVAEFRQAFAGDDADPKRAEVYALAKSSLPDAVVLPLLVEAVGDRQVHIDAVLALRQRTGLQPSPYLGQSSYPDYPPSDFPESWQYWLRDWERDHQRQAQIDQALRDARAADAAATRALKDATRPDEDQVASATSTPSRSQP